MQLDKLKHLKSEVLKSTLEVKILWLIVNENIFIIVKRSWSTYKSKRKAEELA